MYILVLGIYYKLQTFIYLPANGIVQGMRPLIGYNYGAGRIKRVSQIYKIVLCMSGIIMVLGTVICLLIPGQLMGLFTHRSDNQTRENSPAYHQRQFYCLGGFRYIFRRTGGTWKRHSFVTDFPLCRYVVVIIPTAFLLSRLFRSGWRLECVLDHGSDYSNHFYLFFTTRQYPQNQRSQSTVK